MCGMIVPYITLYGNLIKPLSVKRRKMKLPMRLTYGVVID